MYAPDDVGGGMPVHPLTAALRKFRGRKRRPGMFNRAPGMMAPPGMPIGVPPGSDPNTPVDPGFNMTSPAPGTDYSAAIDRMRQLGKGMGQVSWGGKQFSDPNKLWGWEKAHGQTMGKGEFWRLHPDAARRLGMPVDGGGQYQADENPILDQNHLRAGLVGQLQQAQGALSNTAAPGIQRRMAGMVGQQGRRIHAVGAAQARSQALASIMARRLRGRQM